MTTGAAIIAFGPLLVTGFVAFFVAGAGLVWSPIAGLIARDLSPGRGFFARSYGWPGTACSVFLLLPWILLVVALIKGRLPRSVLFLSYFLVYFAWLMGPIAFWGQYVAGIDIFWLGLNEGPDPNSAPGGWIVGYGVLAAMIFLWLGSAVTTARAWESIDDVTPDQLVRFVAIMPFMLVWGCAVLPFGYLTFFKL